MLRRALMGVTKGFYIDVGAGDPVVNSVTAAFYAAGWRGINIEPNSRAHALLFPTSATGYEHLCGCHHGGRPRRGCFYQVEPSSELSTCSSGIANWYRGQGMVIEERFVPARSLALICRQYVNEPIHFLKIDAEGFEREVLLGADFKQYRPWIVAAEATRPLSREISHQFWEGILLSAGYCFRYFDGLNRFYVRADLDHTIGQSFCSPPSIFDSLSAPMKLALTWCSTPCSGSPTFQSNWNDTKSILESSGLSTRKRKLAQRDGNSWGIISIPTINGCSTAPLGRLPPRSAT